MSARTMIVAMLSIALVSTVLATVDVGILPLVRTARVPNDPDDPAIWIHPDDASRSVIVVTNKVRAPSGAIITYDLEGRILQTIPGIDRPNNVDVEHGVRWGDRTIDIVVVTERLRSRLRVWRMDPVARRLVDLGAVPVLDGERGDRAMPMGIGLYRRVRDGAVFAIVSPKSGGTSGYLAQYRLEDDGHKGVRAILARRFGAFSGITGGGDGEIEAVAVDDALGYVYYADEESAIRKYHADPDLTDAGHELAAFGKTGFLGQREGIAVYARPDGTGYIVCTDQRPRASVFRLYRREGEPGDPHRHEPVGVLTSTADSTDGIDVVATPLGGRFPQGLLVAMNSRGKNFFLYAWRSDHWGVPPTP